VVSVTTSTKATTRRRAKRSATSTNQVGVRNKPLSSLTDEALNSYFANLNGHKPGDLYQLVIGEVERPLLRAVLGYTNGNQSEAAEILGINRGTLRKKLKAYKLRGR
jgi:Fis family transcriptional regulator